MASVIAIKSAFRRLLDEHTDIDPYELRRLFTEAIRDLEIERGWDEANRGEPWMDDALRIVLSDAPTKENCLKHARGFGRGYGSIEQIYRWAASSGDDISSKRPDDKFIQQIKRIAKQLGWRA